MTETPQQAAATRRRRWITFGETIGVLALIISAAGLWDSHQQRLAEKAGSSVVAPKAPLVLKASADAEGRTLRISAANGDQVIQTQTIIFPAALAVSSVDSIGNPRIETAWFEDKLHAAVHGDTATRRLPVAIVTRYIQDGDSREDSAIYDIGFSWRSRLLRADAPRLEGMTLVARGGDKLQARLDARWSRAHPAK